MNTVDLPLSADGQMTIIEGENYPLGATCQENGTNFAIFSANAEKIELCLFDDNDNEVARLPLPGFTDDVWHGFISGVKAGCRYGYRVYGPFDPHQGHRFNPNKLLIDPYAKQLSGDFSDPHHYLSYDRSSQQIDLTLDNRDNANHVPKAVVTKELTPCTSHPQIPSSHQIIYELHVKGFTKLHPDLPQNIRGTYAALCDERIIMYLSELGITTIELMPVQQFTNELFLQEKGLSNYWGYNTINFFTPHIAYSHGNNVSEFRHMVERFHQAGIEVILDVVFNHTAEGNELGPTLSFKGIDNASYYRLKSEDKRFYENYSGCGNTLDISHPRVLQLVMDSLRYWVNIMGVDGFRFDLATILGRNSTFFSSESHFFTTLRQDPCLAKVKLIAEPWDIGESGYQLGCFPAYWQEWNDRYRDSCRRFWRGDSGMLPEFARRLHGSSDLFEKPGRPASASINYITAHDGFTLEDLVSYAKKHNQSNGEKNIDGHNSNFSKNYGVEGVTDLAEIIKIRNKQKRNLLTTLMLSQGTPMLLAGDELNHSQHGNNNAYCQDNAMTWLSWDDWQNSTLLPFLTQLLKLRKAHPLLNRLHYQHGLTFSSKTGLADISWINTSGIKMNEDDWHNANLRCFAMLLAETQYESQPYVQEAKIDDDALLLIFNADQNQKSFTLPVLPGVWREVVNTDSAFINHKNTIGKVETPTIEIPPCSCMVLSYSYIEGNLES